MRPPFDRPPPAGSVDYPSHPPRGSADRTFPAEPAQPRSVLKYAPASRPWSCRRRGAASRRRVPGPSTGWAPLRPLSRCPTHTAAPPARPLHVAEFFLPHRFTLPVHRGAGQNPEQRADGRSLAHVLYFPRLDTHQEGFDAVVGDIARRGNRLDILGALVMHHPRPRLLHPALGPGEFLTHLPESGGRNLVGLVVHVNPVGEFEDHAQVVADLHGGAHLAPAHAHRADGPRIEEPVQIVEIVAILLHHEIAGIVFVAEPIAQLLDLGVGIRHPRVWVVGDPERPRVDDFPDLPFLNALVRLQVNQAVALLEARREVLLRILLLRRRDDGLRARQVHAHGLLAIDVLARLHRRHQHARMLEGRGRDHHRVHVAGQQLLEVRIYRRILHLDALGGALHAVREEVAERGDARPRVRVDDARVVRPAASAPDQPHRNLRIGLRPAYRLRRHDREGGGGSRASPADQFPTGNRIHHKRTSSTDYTNYQRGKTEPWPGSRRAGGMKARRGRILEPAPTAPWLAVRYRPRPSPNANNDAINCRPGSSPGLRSNIFRHSAMASGTRPGICANAYASS